ncbi:MAG TPA: pyruvate formate lyase family protein, partial [Rhizomicrobium sp.]
MDRVAAAVADRDVRYLAASSETASELNFSGTDWKREINVRDFIQHNVTPYLGDESFLAPPTERTKALWAVARKLMDEEHAKGGTLDMDTEIVSTIVSHQPGYISKELEQVVGLQTDKPLKRAFMPFGGIRVAESALEAYGYKAAPQLHDFFTHYRKTHNDGVFDVYTDPVRKARKAGIITGLPDGYGRGRIIGDYR